MLNLFLSFWLVVAVGWMIVDISQYNSQSQEIEDEAEKNIEDQAQKAVAKIS